jgi:hypothetical protein
MEPKIFWVRGARTGVRIRKEEGLINFLIFTIDLDPDG